VDRQIFELPAARAFWRKLERNGIVVTSMGASIFLVGAALEIANKLQPWDFRVRVAVLFVGAAAFILAFVWTPLRPNYAARRAPIRLSINDEMVILEVLGGPPTRVAWNDPGFQLSVWTWPPRQTGRPPFSLDLGRYSGVPIEAEPYEGIRAAVLQHHCTEEATTFRLPFGQKGVARRITYRRPGGHRMTGAD
jgi:hypothetical protein